MLHTKWMHYSILQPVARKEQILELPLWQKVALVTYFVAPGVVNNSLWEVQVAVAVLVAMFAWLRECQHLKLLQYPHIRPGLDERSLLDCRQRLEWLLHGYLVPGGPRGDSNNGGLKWNNLSLVCWE